MCPTRLVSVAPVMSKREASVRATSVGGGGAPGEQVDVDEDVFVVVEEVGAQRVQHQVAHSVGLRAQDHHCARTQHSTA